MKWIVIAAGCGALVLVSVMAVWLVNLTSGSGLDAEPSDADSAQSPAANRSTLAGTSAETSSVPILDETRVEAAYPESLAPISGELARSFATVDEISASRRILSSAG